MSVVKKRRSSTPRNAASSEDASNGGPTANENDLLSGRDDDERKNNTVLVKCKAQQLVDQPVHFAHASLFSTSSGWTNYRGFFNLAVLLLVISNGRVALENFIKYGLLISPIQWIEYFLASSPASWPNITILLLSNVTILAAFLLEIMMAKRLMSNYVGGFLYVVMIVAHITWPAIIMINSDCNPFFSSNVLSLFVIQALKLVSYGHVNYWCRLARDDKSCNASKLLYPNNLTLKDLYYFIWAPTLCYELNFPRTPKRRWSFIFKRLVEIISFSFVCVALCQQWVLPLVKNSIAPFSGMDVTRCVERVLKLAIPNHLIWLLWFYLYFHGFLNLLAELLRFADREFYLDFWNSETVAVFWKTWNIPVHRWCVRHVYKPMVRNGYSKFFASLTVFVISAFFHEYLLSVPLKIFRLWAFYGMLAQFPLSFLTEAYLKRGRAGNIVMWLSLILGQPMAILMYVHDWYLINTLHKP